MNAESVHAILGYATTAVLGGIGLMFRWLGNRFVSSVDAVRADVEDLQKRVAYLEGKLGI